MAAQLLGDGGQLRAHIFVSQPMAVSGPGQEGVKVAPHGAGQDQDDQDQDCVPAGGVAEAQGPVHQGQRKHQEPRGHMHGKPRARSKQSSEEVWHAPQQVAQVEEQAAQGEPTETQAESAGGPQVAVGCGARAFGQGKPIVVPVSHAPQGGDAAHQERKAKVLQEAFAFRPTDVLARGCQGRLAILSTKGHAAVLQELRRWDRTRLNDHPVIEQTNAFFGFMQQVDVLLIDALHDGLRQDAQALALLQAFEFLAQGRRHSMEFMAAVGERDAVAAVCGQGQGRFHGAFPTTHHEHSFALNVPRVIQAVLHLGQGFPGHLQTPGTPTLSSGQANLVRAQGGLGPANLVALACEFRQPAAGLAFDQVHLTSLKGLMPDFEQLFAGVAGCFEQAIARQVQGLGQDQLLFGVVVDRSAELIAFEQGHAHARGRRFDGAGQSTGTGTDHQQVVGTQSALPSIVLGRQVTGHLASLVNRVANQPMASGFPDQEQARTAGHFKVCTQSGQVGALRQLTPVQANRA